VRKAQDAITQALKVGVSGSVTLEGGAIAVVAPGVGLHDHTLLPPEEVDFVPSNTRINLGLGKAVATAEAEHELLQFASRELLLPLEVRRADQATVEGFADGALIYGLGNGAVEVAQGSRGLRDRDAVAERRNTGARSCAELTTQC
jgi:hypothetical protein